MRLLVLLGSAALAATPIAGLSLEPLSRADLVWVAEDRTSGTGVGEFDGVVDPELSAFVGFWGDKRLGLVGSLGVARLTTTSWVGDVYQQRHWGVVRPEVDLRVSLTDRAVGRPAPWAVVGLYGDIPSARDVSNAFTEEEEQAADEGALEERLRLGGFGGRLGAGLDHRLNEHVAIGAQWSLRGHFGVLRSEDASTVSSWVATETALLLTFAWPREPRRTGDRPVEIPEGPAKD